MMTWSVLRRCVTTFFLAFIFLSLAACGNTNARVEPTPSVSPSFTSTIAALETENARLSEQLATPSVTSTPAPTPTADLGRLAYVQGGDIWVKTLPNGEPRQLMSDNRNEEPRWSPSGQWLAFRKGSHVWVSRIDGTGAYPLHDGAEAFAWSPMADRLAYVTWTGDLYVIQADGTGLVRLVARALPRRAGRVGRIAWRPDGSWIAYEWWGQQQPAQTQTSQGLWMVSAGGGEPIQLFDTSDFPKVTEAVLAGWTSDGRYLLYWRAISYRGSLSDSAPLDSLSVEDSTRKVAVVEPVPIYSDFVAPAPAGSTEVATVRGSVLHVASAVNGKWIWLLTPTGIADSSPTWSPDGQHIAYIAMPEQPDLFSALMQRRLWLVAIKDAALPKAQQLTNDPTYRDERPLWSADGQFILFARLDRDGWASLWLLPVAGGNTQQVVDEISPIHDPFSSPGHIDWDRFFAWWRGRPVQPVQPETTPTPDRPPHTGAVLGAICYPSEVIPPMTVYFENTATHAVTALDIAIDQQSYEIDLPPGQYIAYAWPPDSPIGGSYSQAVLCGLDVACTDHSLARFEVSAGQTTSGIDICDWYSPGDVPFPPSTIPPSESP